MDNDEIKLANLNNFLKGENADYSIYEDRLNLASATEGAKHYGISLNETTPTFILKSKD